MVIGQADIRSVGREGTPAPTAITPEASTPNDSLIDGEPAQRHRTDRDIPTMIQSKIATRAGDIPAHGLFPLVVAGVGFEPT